ncbi:MAG: glycosyltransferase [Akkermansiaceae bacterium]|nr:glycosyltransferase [Armatimonadota bacterium]
MNLLVLSPWFPCPPDNGSRLRAFHLIREWANAGHAIRLVTGLQEDIASRADYGALRQLCESVAVFPWRWHDGGSRGDIRDLLSHVPRSISETDNSALRDAMIKGFLQKPDACIAMELASAPFIPKRPNGIPVVLEQVEVSGVARAAQEAQGARAIIRTGLTRAKHDNYWRRELKRFDALTSVSAEEATAVRSLVGSERPPVIVVPNGVDIAYYSHKHVPTPVAGRAIYNGSLTYGPNREAVAWFVQEILPLIAKEISDAHLVVTGAIPQSVGEPFAGNPRVIFTDYVSDIRPILASAVICTVPLKTGGGTRLKILEAWAARVPVVSTRVGASGLAGSEDGRHLLLADTPKDFASACTRLLGQPDRRQQIAARARQLAEERYNWRDLAGQITDLLPSPGANNDGL